MQQISYGKGLPNNVFYIHKEYKTSRDFKSAMILLLINAEMARLREIETRNR